VKEFSGIVLLDKSEIVLRVYQIDGTEWRLFNYFKKSISPDTPRKEFPSALSYIVKEIIASSFTRQVSQWRICSRRINKAMLTQIAQEIGMSIEPLSYPREQELLSKGMFTELW
jgi:hypothetical protein